MIATATSKTKRRIWTNRRVNKIKWEAWDVWLPRRVRRRWPAIILAESRTVKVPGRIILLMVSIKTIKGIKRLGVLKGTKCANICLVLLTQP